MPPQVHDLPKSLRQMIADCQNAIANWDSENVNEDSDSKALLDSTRDWTLRLSRGEFEQDLYWECVADDCEEAGDWAGALSAYQQILSLPDELGLTHSKALTGIALLQRLQGHDGAALKFYHLATAKSTKLGGAMAKVHLVSEALQLLRMGHIRRARRLIRQGRTEVPCEIVDHLGTAQLLIASAKCDLADNKTATANQSLRNAWEWLDALVQSYAGDEDFLRQAAGIHLAFATWWSTEARRRKIAREELSETVALENAIEKVRLCFTPCGYQRPCYDLRLMNLLLQLADAYERVSLMADAAMPRKEAEAIFITRRFPESAKWPRYDDWRPARFSFLRNWCVIFRGTIEANP